MKQLFAYLLILVLIASDNTFREFLKMPILVKHFIDHYERDASISFKQFISMHYLGNDLKDNDLSQDMKLPFKKISGNSHHLLFKEPLPADSFHKEFCVIEYHKIYLEPGVQNQFGNKLYRPPKLTVPHRS